MKKHRKCVFGKKKHAQDKYPIQFFFLLEKNNNTETHRLALKVGSQQYYK